MAHRTFSKLLMNLGCLNGKNWYSRTFWEKSQFGDNRLQHMRRAIALARLCTRLKHWARAKRNTSCFIKKASRCATDHTSKTTTFFIFRFLYNTKILRENHVYCYLLGSVVKIVLCLHFLYTKDSRLRQIKKTHEWWNNHFSDVFTYCLDLKYFASLFFLAKR